ncbi:hypothetical protein QBC35DRAFT_448006 [Podospora australis]|uniref:Transmembrane and coiled-coil domain-containing protein n=1 Tax=Podospora australis TaxID=1536484 RepID=A0AAN7AK94_9PEZI|nr:hypothetical protein QBC35DRAFT_448006 [Podospora australis]
MAPLATDPRQILTVLNLAKRRALYTLLIEITAWMRSQLEFSEPGPAASSSGDAPLLIDPNAPGGSSIIEQPSTPGTTSSSQQPSPELIRLRAAALEHFDVWRKDALTKLKELLAAQDDAKIVEDRKRRTERISRLRKEVPSPGESLIDFGFSGMGSAGAEEERIENEKKKAVATLQAHWHAIPTRLTSLAEEDRQETLSCVLLVLLSTGHYSGESRALAVYLTSALELPLEVLNNEEIEVAKAMVEGSEEAARRERAGGSRTSSMSADAEAEQRKQQNQASRFWKVGLASVAGAAIIGVTGGLAAPVVAGAIGGIMGSVGLGGLASFMGIFWMNGALVGTLFGAFGARMTGEMVDQYAREVEDFKFIPLKDEWGTGKRISDKDARRLRVTIGINGWLTSKDDITKPWRYLAGDSEVFALRYEMKSLMGLGQSLQDLVSSYAWNTVKVEILKRTVLATLWSALWPAYLLSAASTIDNPFNLAKNRSEKAGEVLADALINKVQGERPVTLIGYSLGARVIYSCLRSLAKRRAFGLIDSVVFIGAPVPSDKQHWHMMRSVVSGKIFNVYSKNDMLLAFLYRATSIQLGIAGLQDIRDIEGVENLDLSEEVEGHMRYANLIEKILVRCGFPCVKGVEGSIEKEQSSNSVITLDDLDKSKTGVLIDFGDLTIASSSSSNQAPAARVIQEQHQPSSPALPSYSPTRSAQRGMGRSKPTVTAPSRTTISRASTTPVSSSGLDPLGGMVPTSSLPPSRSSASSSTQPNKLLAAAAAAGIKTTASHPAPPPNLYAKRPPAVRPSPSYRSQSSTTNTTATSSSDDFFAQYERSEREPSNQKFAYMDSASRSSARSPGVVGDTRSDIRGHRSLPSYGTASRTSSFPAVGPSSSAAAGADHVDTTPYVSPGAHLPLKSSHDNHHYDEPESHDEDDNDSDDGGGWGGGIKMVDNDDGDLVFVDPSPIQD